MTKKELETELSHKETLIEYHLITEKNLEKRIITLEKSLEELSNKLKEEKKKNKELENKLAEGKAELKNVLEQDALMEKLLSKNETAKIKNERNAGRKSIITDKLVNDVIKLSESGVIQKLISDELNVSVGTVNKIIKEHLKKINNE